MKYCFLTVTIIIASCSTTAKKNGSNYQWHLKPDLDLGDGYIERILDDNGLSMVKNNGKYGMISTDGVFEVPCISDEPLIRKGLIPMKKDGKIGLVNLEGDTLYPFNADRFGYLEPNFYLLETGSQTLIVQENGEPLKTEYDIRTVNDHSFSENAISVEVWLDKGHTETGGGYIDASGKSLMPFIYRYNEPFSKGIAGVRSLDYMKNYFIDKKGNIVFECPEEWGSISSFEGDLALIDVKEKEGFAFINRKFEMVIPPQYNAYSGFKNGLYIVSNDKSTGAIDKTGKVIVPFEYDDLEVLTPETFIVTKIFFKKHYDDPDQLWAFDNTYNRKGVFDIDSRSLTLPLEYDDIAKADDDLLQVEKNGKCGYIDMKGNAYIPLVFEKAKPFFLNRAWVKYEGKWGVIEKL